MLQKYFKGLFYYLEDFRLRLHFTRAIQYLHRNPPAQTQSTAQQAGREMLIQRLREYRQQNIFPRNSGGRKTQPYFIDKQQRACAVADLLINTGQHELVGRIHAFDNNALVQNMQFDELLLWAQQHGLSKEELSVVQPTYYEPHVQDLPILILSCANLFFLIMYGRQHVHNTLIGLGITGFLLYALKHI